MSDITELVDKIRRERPKADTAMAEALVDLIEAMLTGPVDIQVAVDRYVAKVNEHIDRRVRRYLNGVEVIG